MTKGIGVDIKPVHCGQSFHVSCCGAALEGSPSLLLRALDLSLRTLPAGHWREKEKCHKLTNLLPFHSSSPTVLNCKQGWETESFPFQKFIGKISKHKDNLGLISVPTWFWANKWVIVCLGQLMYPLGTSASSLIKWDEWSLPLLHFTTV